jgi:hypothetical protein
MFVLSISCGWTAPDFAPTACDLAFLALTAGNATMICKWLKS